MFEYFFSGVKSFQVSTFMKLKLFKYYMLVSAMLLTVADMFK